MMGTALTYLIIQQRAGGLPPPPVGAILLAPDEGVGFITQADGGLILLAGDGNEQETIGTK